MKLSTMQLSDKGDIELVYVDNEDGYFMMGETFIPTRITVTIPKDKFKDLKELMKRKPTCNMK